MRPAIGALGAVIGMCNGFMIPIVRPKLLAPKPREIMLVHIGETPPIASPITTHDAATAANAELTASPNKPSAMTDVVMTPDALIPNRSISAPNPIFPENEKNAIVEYSSAVC
jgi:hypothetical protein